MKGAVKVKKESSHSYTYSDDDFLSVRWVRAGKGKGKRRW